MLLQIKQKPWVVAFCSLNGKRASRKQLEKSCDVVGVHLHRGIEQGSSANHVGQVVQNDKTVSQPINDFDGEAFSRSACVVQDCDTARLEGFQKPGRYRKSPFYGDVLKNKEGMDEVVGTDKFLRKDCIWIVATSFLEHGLRNIHPNCGADLGQGCSYSACSASEIEGFSGDEVWIEKFSDVGEDMGKVRFSALEKISSGLIGKTAPVLGIAQNREVGISDTPLLPVPVCVHGKQE